MSEISETIRQLIQDDKYGPYPAEGKMIRCFLHDGQVIDGAVGEVTLDLDKVVIYVLPGKIISAAVAYFKVIAADGDTWAEL